MRKFGPARKQFGNFVKLEPDVAAVFPNDTIVNEVLRGLIEDSKTNRNTHSYRLPMKGLDPVSKQCSNSIVKLESDVAAVFSDAASVNKVLQRLIQDSKQDRTVPPCTGDGT